MKKTPLELGRRERQIVETVAALGEATVAEVLERLEEPPSYSTVRKMLSILVDKKWLKVKQEGKRYVYRMAANQEKARRKAITRLLGTFFAGSRSEALNSLLDTTSDQLTFEELESMSQMIERAKKELK